jgi:hypothetical protein
VERTGRRERDPDPGTGPATRARAEELARNGDLLQRNAQCGGT